MRANDDTNWITKFNISITSNSNRVFANGRHQLEVSVSVSPKSGQEISAEQMESLHLVTLDDDGVYRKLSGELDASERRDKRFEYYADTGSAPNNLQLESSSRRKRFYISSTRPGGSRDIVYAAISKDADTQYVSHTSRFNSAVTVESLTPLRMTRDDFIFDGEDRQWETLDSLTVDYDVYHLSFRSSRLKIVESIAYGAKEEVCYAQNNIDITPGYYFFYVSFENATFRYQNHFHYAIKVGPEKEFRWRDTPIKVNNRSGVMNFVRVKVTGDDFSNVPYSTPSRWGLLDQYGNEHKIEMTQESDGNIPNFIMFD